MKIEVQEPLLKTVGRRLYTRPSCLPDGSATPANMPSMLVYLLENGKMLDHVTLKEFEPDSTWHHAESFPEEATYVLKLEWSDPKWGEPCIALFGSAEDASRFAEQMNIGRHSQQKVRLVR